MSDITCDYLLKNVSIIDGTNSEEYVADVALEKDIIIKIGKNLTDLNPKNTINCINKILCPGFIDCHGHSELQVLRNPSMVSKIQQGITTEVAGNCGVGVYPIDLNNKEIVESIYSGTRDVLGEYKYNWNDFESFCNEVRKNGTGTNMMFLQSHTALRANVIFPSANRKATDEEIQKMCKLLNESLNQGCIGFSSGLYYAPCVYADEKELLALLRVVKMHDKIFAVHHRCEGDDVISSLKEVISLAKKSGVRLEVSHLKAIGKDNQKYVPQMLELIDKAQQDGVRIGFDQYPYDFGSTSLYSLLPPSYLKLSGSELKKALGCKTDREKMKSLIKKGEGWDSLIKMCGFKNISTMYLETQRKLEHLTLKEIAKLKYGKTDEDSLFSAFFDLLRDESGVALMMDVTQSEESMEKILKHPLMCFGTDALYSNDTDESVPCHPRSYQAAVHYLELFYKKKHSLSLNQLIYNMTGKSADRLRLKNRGKIKENYKADLVLLDIDKLEDISSISKPKTTPRGIEAVFVNGNLVYKEGKIVSSPSGEIILQ